MNILLLCNKPPYPPKDGGAFAVLNMATDLVHLGHSVTILAVSTQKHTTRPDQIPAAISQLIDFHFVEINTEISLKAILLNLLLSQTPYIADRFKSDQYRDELIKLLQQKEFDIVQLEGPYLSHYIPEIRNYSKARLSYRAHNIEHEIWKRKARIELNLIKRIYLFILARRIRRFESALINQYDLLVPITQRDLDTLTRMGNTKPACIAPFGINLDSISKLTVSPMYPSLFYLGALDWMPNQEGLKWFIQKVWPELHQKYPALEFHVAGRNAPEFMIRLFQQPGIRFHGEIDKSAEYLQKWAIMISPIFAGSGMRVKIVEGMALGKVIVTTTIGTEGISTTHQKNIFIADSREGFIKYLSRLIDNKELFEEVSNNAILFSQQHFDNKKIIQELSRFYQGSNDK